MFLQQLESSKLPPISGEKLDEEFTFARLYISKVKSEVKSVVQHSAQLDLAMAENSRKMEELEKSLFNNTITVQQASFLIAKLSSYH